MRRILILSAVLALLTDTAVAADCRGPQGLPLPGPALPLVEGQFRYVPDQGLGCVVSNRQGQAMASHSGPVTFLPCLRVGAVAVADSRAKVESLLGTAAAVNEIDLSSDSRIYSVPQRGALLPHYVVTYRDGVVVAVQLIGPPMVMPATFSGLTLGDDRQKVIDTLGWPVQRCRTKADGPEMWTWPPFPIAVDMIEGYVAGFKVTWTAAD